MVTADLSEDLVTSCHRGVKLGLARSSLRCEVAVIMQQPSGGFEGLT